MKYTIDQNEFKRFTTRTISIPVLASLVLSIVFVFIIFHLMNVSDWVNHSSRVVSQTRELFQLCIDAETGVRGFLNTGDERFLEPYHKSVQQIDDKFAEAINMVSDNPTQSNALKEIQGRLKEWMTYGSGVIELKRQGKDYEKILPAMDRKTQMDTIRILFSRFIAVEESLRNERVENTNQTVLLALGITLGGSLLVGILLAIFTRKQLTTLSTTYGNVIQKQTEQNLMLEAQEWIQTGRSGLMDQIRGDHSVEELSNNILQYICHRLDGKVAALYNQEASLLRRTGTFAFSEAAGKNPKTLRMGEGLIGQTAMENKLTVLKDIPENYLTVSSSIGSAKPREIVFVPLSSDNQVKAVLEIGFFDSVSDRALEFLESISESIAIAIKSAEYRATLRDLLEESQRQTEELQAQQEELQANNEELEEQTNALKESQARLETQQSELEQTNAQLSKQSAELEIQSEAAILRNEELRKAQANLEQKARELELSSQYKSQFLANMSHELRTPLNSTLILSQLLLEDKRSRLGQEEKEFVQTILSSSNDLLHLINDILDLSKVEAGKIELEPENVEVTDFTQTIERLFKPIANNKAIEFKIIVEKDVPMTIYQDRQRIEQILKNLVSNAVKFTNQGSVTLRISKSTDKIHFSVIDTGIGIPQEQQNIIFDAFKQADGTTSRKYGGTGLGLTISRDLARLLGGDIFVSSETGKGSHFTLTVPAKFNEVVKLEGVPTPPVFIKPVGPVAPEIIKKAEPLPHKPLPFTDDRNKLNKPFKILLVIEDDTNFAKILYDLSHELKFDCIVTQTAEEGIEAAEEFLPQAIILDMHLPDRSGLTVIDSLKMNAKTRHIPIHIVSAQDQENMALKMGAVGYLRKPVALQDIKGAIAKMEEKLTHSMKKVLVVEDNKVQRESIKELIQNSTVEVIIAENAHNALDELKKHSFDCMILDLHLPGMTGYELLEKMTETKLISRPPVIVYTGKDLSKVEEQKLQKYSQSIILKGAHSPERLFSEVTLFLHQVETQLPKERQNILQSLRDREKIFDGKKILLVDDDVRNIFALSSALEGKGATIETARNGKEAVDKVKNDPAIDLVLMDIMMPEMDGFEATKEIRKDSRFARLPIIAVTAKAMADDQEKCREAGANDYLAKPVDLTKLLSLLRVWMPSSGRL